MPETPADTIRRAADSLNSLADMAERHPGARITISPLTARTLADFLTDHARQKFPADGSFTWCDSPADTEAALKIAREYLGETP